MMKKFILLILLLSFVLISAEKSGRDAVFEKPLWKHIYEDYSSDPGIIDAIRQKIGKLDSIKVYFAFWCGDSERNVPPFMKILDELGESGIEVNYFIVERKKPGEKYYHEKLKVERVPAFIFFKDGTEVGRIIENPQKTLEEDFLDIVF